MLSSGWNCNYLASAMTYVLSLYFSDGIAGDGSKATLTCSLRQLCSDTNAYSSNEDTFFLLSPAFLLK